MSITYLSLKVLSCRAIDVLLAEGRFKAYTFETRVLASSEASN
jgi:hypothetical protein